MCKFKNFFLSWGVGFGRFLNVCVFFAWVGGWVNVIGNFTIGIN